MRAWVDSKGTKAERLRAIRDIGPYRGRQLQRLLPFFDEISLPAGSLIAREGDPCAMFVVVMRGRLTATQAGARARVLTAGDTFGWDEMWERQPNPATIVVDADARLLVMGHAQFRAIKAVANS